MDQVMGDWLWFPLSDKVRGWIFAVSKFCNQGQYFTTFYRTKLLLEVLCHASLETWHLACHVALWELKHFLNVLTTWYVFIFLIQPFV